MSFKNDLEKIRLQWTDIVFNGPSDVLGILEGNQWDVRLAKSISDANHYIGPLEGLLFGVAVVMGIPIVRIQWLKDDGINIEDYTVKYPTPPPLFNGVAVVVEANESAENREQLKTLVNLLGGRVIELASSDGLTDVIRSNIKNESAILFSSHQSESFKTIAHKCNSELLTTQKLVQMVVDGRRQFRVLSLPVKREPESQLTETQTSQPSRRRKRFKKAGLMDFFDFASSSQLAPPDNSLAVPASSPTKEPSVQIENVSDDPKIEIQSLQAPTVKKEPLILSISSPVRDLLSDIVLLPVRNHEEDRSQLPEPDVQNDVLLKDDTKILEPLKAQKHARDAEEGTENNDIKRPRKYVPQVSFYDAIKATKEKATEQVKDELGLDINNDEVETKLSNLVIVETFDIQIRHPRKEKLSPLKSAYNKKNFKKFKKNIKLKSRITRSFVDVEDIPQRRQSTLQEATHIVEEDPEHKMAQDFDGLLNDISGYNPENDKLTEYQDEEEGFSFQSGSGLFVDEDSQPSVPTPSSKAKPSRSSKRKTPKTNITHDIPNDDDDEDDDIPSFSFRRKRR